MAKRIIRDAARQYTDSGTDGSGTEVATRTEDEGYEGMQRSRTQHQSISTRSEDEVYDGARNRRRRDQSASPRRGGSDLPDEVEAAELAALSTLASKHRRSLRLVQSVYLGCAFDLESTEIVLEILKEFDLGTIRLSPDADREAYARAKQAAADEIFHRVRVIWSPAQDRKLLQRRGRRSDEKVARAKDIPVAKVQERRDALEVIQATGMESWYPDAEGFERWTSELVDEDDDAGEESELEPLP